MLECCSLTVHQAMVEGERVAEILTKRDRMLPKEDSFTPRASEHVIPSPRRFGKHELTSREGWKYLPGHDHVHGTGTLKSL